MQRALRSTVLALSTAALAAVFALANGCQSDVQEDGGEGDGSRPSEQGGPGGAEQRTEQRTELGIPVLGYEVVARYPHDRGAYTQGLLFLDGALYESTGQEGESTVRRVDLESGQVEQSRDLAPTLFGEGLAATGDLLVQLTWKRREALIYERETLRKLDYTYGYEGEGWGLTTRDDGMFIMSDGSSTLRIIDPKGFDPIGTIEVTAAGRPVGSLNELEWVPATGVQPNELEMVKGEIWANIWKSDRIARIDPETGEVKAWVDLSGLLAPDRVANPYEEVLNGIAYDAEGDRLFVTGKRWPRLFEIRVDELR